jgi:predicted glycogen debranching enzyme
LSYKLIFDKPDFQTVSGKEWIVTNGIGGYASSSVCGANTRRYHGLLVASYTPPTDRRVLVSKVEEKIIFEGKEFLIGSNAYPDTIHPHGYQYLTSFERMPLPKSVFAFEKASITKSIYMRYGRNTSIVEYQNTGTEIFLLELTPLMVCRDYHLLFHEDIDWIFDIQYAKEKILKIESGKNAPPVYVRFSEGTFFPEGDWYKNFQYAREEERGLDFHEDAKSIGKINCLLAPGDTTYLILSTDLKDTEGDPAKWKTEEEKRIRLLNPKEKNPFINDLIISGDQFLVKRRSSSSDTLIAGYHWFTDWGRDTMIAMRGLIIAAGKKEESESILQTFLHYLDQGMIPNRFPDDGEKPEYNTMDATLWLFVALYDYFEQFEDLNFIRGVFKKLTTILDLQSKGTRYNIHQTPEGLLYGGQEGIQLTWMDARVGDYVVTPRIGCPVEINALWYNALCIYVHFGKKLGQDVSVYAGKAKQFSKIFAKYFVNRKGYLNDVVVPGKYVDDAIRPNQLYAISLPFSPLTSLQAKQVLQVIGDHLYTDYGLRSLSPEHPDFKPIFTGDQWHRDGAYHQGTVWGFLWGEYALAYLKVHKYTPQAKKWVRDHVQKLKHHFYNEDGLYAISENFDGLHPGPGKGCIQQAWSVGMTALALLNAEK